MKTLIIDVETAPNVAYVWGAWKQNIGLKQMAESTYLLSFAAKWLEDYNVTYVENRKDDERALVEHCIALLDEADVVIAHNADKFDIPIIQGRAIALGLAPPSPFKTIDTLKVARYNFRFPMNTLAYLAEALGCAPKLSHKKFPGFELWLECLRQNDEAWKEMKTYNIQDVLTLEELYLKMRPWIRNHPNIANYQDTEDIVCPKCGSSHVVKRGFYYTQVMKYQRFRCTECGAWSRGRYTARERGARHDMVTGV